MFNWYKKADPTDDSIIEYFSEYKDCISPTHPVFRSNYGVYMYAESGLYKCYNELVNNSLSRRACVVINDRAVMQNDGEIDKLCTNAIHYFIDGKYLNCVVQMRSSDMATLLPYDAFMFSVFFVELWQMLKSHYAWLQPGCITMQVANAHFSFGKVPQRCYDTSIIMHDVDLLSLVASMKASFADNLRTFYI